MTGSGGSRWPFSFETTYCLNAGCQDHALLLLKSWQGPQHTQARAVTSSSRKQHLAASLSLCPPRSNARPCCVLHLNILRCTTQMPGPEAHLRAQSGLRVSETCPVLLRTCSIGLDPHGMGCVPCWLHSISANPRLNPEMWVLNDPKTWAALMGPDAETHMLASEACALLCTNSQSTCMVGLCLGQPPHHTAQPCNTWRLPQRTTLTAETWPPHSNRYRLSRSSRKCVLSHQHHM